MENHVNNWRFQFRRIKLKEVRDAHGAPNDIETQQHLLGAIVSALRPYPEALAQLDRTLAELLGESPNATGGGEGGPAK
jgi:hypothetical protein